MTSADYPSTTGSVSAGVPQGGAGSSDPDTTSTTDKAKDEGKHLAGVAAGEAQNVAGEAKTQARNMMGEARSQVEQQSRTQRDKLVQTLRGLGTDLDQMSSQAPSGMASDLTGQLAERAQRLSSHLEGREPSQILDDMRSFARRRPGTFLLGALAAGVVAGRLARGAQAASGSSGSGTSYDTGYGGTVPATGTGAYPATGTGVGYGAGVTGTDPLLADPGYDPGVGGLSEPVLPPEADFDTSIAQGKEPL
jgi:hypothetical protein